jgi:XTP/dITP diphosphohydrolase
LIKLVIATTNKGKLKEIRKILAEIPLELLSLSDFENVPDVIEDKETFLDNAKKKAKEIYEHIKLPVIADDSGLAVDQLNGRPGVYSARYFGENATDEKNNKKLISELTGLASPHKAKFISVAVYYNGNEYISSTGELPGEIILSPRGNNGFGYDPLFVPEGFKKTLAELTLEEKNKISHRAKAFNNLKLKLNTKLK